MSLYLEMRNYDLSIVFILNVFKINLLNIFNAFLVYNT